MFKRTKVLALLMGILLLVSSIAAAAGPTLAPAIDLGDTVTPNGAQGPGDGVYDPRPKSIGGPEVAPMGAQGPGDGVYDPRPR